MAFDDVLESVNLTYNISQIMQVCIKSLADLEAMEQALKSALILLKLQIPW